MIADTDWDQPVNDLVIQRPYKCGPFKVVHCKAVHLARCIKFRVGTERVQGNGVHTIAIWSLEVPNLNFQPIPS